MAKHKIRWRESDRQELARKVRNFNAKIDRLSKREDMQHVTLPDKIKLRELKKDINSRSDLNRELKAMEQFSKKGSEQPITNKYGLSATKWEIRQTKLKVNRINRYREKKRKELADQEATLRGEPLGYTRTELMGTARKAELREKVFHFDNIKSTDWKMLLKSINIQSDSYFEDKRLMQMKINYIAGMEGEGYSERIREAIEAMDPKEFEKIFYREELGDFHFMYDKNISLEERESTLLQIYSSAGKK